MARQPIQYQALVEPLQPIVPTGWLGQSPSPSSVQTQLRIGWTAFAPDSSIFVPPLSWQGQLLSQQPVAQPRIGWIAVAPDSSVFVPPLAWQVQQVQQPSSTPPFFGLLLIHAGGGIGPGGVPFVISFRKTLSPLGAAIGRRFPQPAYGGL